MHLVTGLGNPGAKYAGHRHNVGFMVVDQMARRWSADAFREKFQAQFARGRIDSHEVGWLKPQTFMNLSGQSVQKAMAFFKVELPQLIVVHDELDLGFGTFKLKVGGGTAGHNGLKSIVSCCGGQDFVRLRVGIGRPRSGAPEHHVLSDFSREECSQLENVLESASLAVADVVRLGVQAAMNLHNQAAKSPKITSASE
jgi:PTH1 family peptidyl-tRNA hydrolase